MASLPSSPTPTSSPDTTTRKRTPPPKETAAHLPPPRQKSPLRRVSPPGSHTKLSTHIYVLVLLTTLLLGYYSYRLVQYKTSVGGWWSLMLGRKPVAMQAQGGEPAVGGYEAGSGSNWNGWRAKQPPKANTGEDTVEAHIQGLAAALGMPTNEVASAIASAVRAYVPPASLSSIAAKETGEAVRVLLQEPSQGEGEGAVPGVAAAGGSASGKKDTTGKVVEGIVTGMEAMVGMDEP